MKKHGIKSKDLFPETFLWKQHNERKMEKYPSKASNFNHLQIEKPNSNALMSKI